MPISPARVLISILNWNKSQSTIDCVNSIIAGHQHSIHKIKIRVLDNNSSEDEKNLLRSKIATSTEVIFLGHNTGFAGGQNINLQHAIDEQYDFVWLLNNDTLIPEKTVDNILSQMAPDKKCGAASPIIVRMNDPKTIDFCGAMHTWENLGSIRPQSTSEAMNLCLSNPDKIWAVGTALMLKTEMIKEIGLLNEKLFAYFEDDDLGERIIASKWQTKIIFTAKIEHDCFNGEIFRRPPYYFYLMSRNEVIFTINHTPARFRRFLRLRLVDKLLHLANRLENMNQNEKANACLLGLADGLAQLGGPPNLNRRVPLWLHAIKPIGKIWNSRHR